MNRDWTKLSVDELKQLEQELNQQYADFKAKGLALDMSRGKPGPEQLDISMQSLDKMENYHTPSGLDTRNYGVLDGIPELKKLFGELLEISPERIIIGGNSSLNLMYDQIVRLILFGTEGYPAWKTLDKIKFICPVPGYDRHFGICESLGIEMINVPMTIYGPNVDEIEKIVANDPSVKGMWCVPLYSNPQGICCSDETVKRLAAMKTAASDFRIFWDNAYAVHHLRGEKKLANIFTACEQGGNPNRAYMFFSTSKITFPGAGVSLIATSEKNKAEILNYMTYQTIGHDKINQLRTLNYLKNADGVKKQMAKHAELLRPKFDVVLTTLDKELAGTGLATWNKPEGGYFVALDTMKDCAKETLRLAKDAGLKMTGAGATFPYHKDPNDTSIRIAPSYPSCDTLRSAMQLFTICVKLAGVKKLLNQ